MIVEAIQALGPQDEVAPPLRAPAAAALPDFAQRISEGLQGMNQQLLANQVDLQQLAAGQVHNLHEVMVRLEESRISLQLLLQVRNRVLEAYQDVMRMQV
jgi:flagellar hook-basal body complex protein FliE